MAEFDDVLARIQNQLDRMKRSLSGRKREYQRIAEREPDSRATEQKIQSEEERRRNDRAGSRKDLRNR
jgi:hypothetical protein